MATQHEPTIASLHERFDAFADAVLAELRALRAQAPEPALYCPRETVESYQEHKGGRVLDVAPGTVLCPGGYRLQLSRSNPKPDARQAADDFFHALPEGTTFTARYGQAQRFTMRHHNVWRSAALTLEQARLLGLPGVQAEEGGSTAAAAAPVVENGSGTRAAHLGGDGGWPAGVAGGGGRPAGAPAALPTREEAVERMLAWARGHWGSTLSLADLTRAAGGGDWQAILDRHGGDWRAVAETVRATLAGGGR